MKIHKMLGNGTGVLALAGALLGNYESKGQEAVIFRAIAGNLEWKVGSTNDVVIEINNKPLQDKETAGFLWKKSVNIGLNVIESKHPSVESDFFRDFPLNNNFNYEGVRETYPQPDPSTGKFFNEGPASRVGELWNYKLAVNGNSKIGMSGLSLLGFRAFSGGYSGEIKEQKTIVQNLGVAVVPSDGVKEPVIAVNMVQSYDSSNNRIDVVPSVYVAGRTDKKYKLQASSDLKNWSDIYTNDVNGSFNYSDVSGKNESRRFYRAVEAGN